jgi:hypothetical protein
MADKPPTYMSAEEFREIFRLLDLSIERDSGLLLISKKTLYRYKAGTAPIRPHFAMALREMLYRRRPPAEVMALAFPLRQGDARGERCYG